MCRIVFGKNEAVNKCFDCGKSITPFGIPIPRNWQINADVSTCLQESTPSRKANYHYTPNQVKLIIFTGEQVLFIKPLKQ